MVCFLELKLCQTLLIFRLWVLCWVSYFYPSKVSYFIHLRYAFIMVEHMGYCYCDFRSDDVTLPGCGSCDMMVDRK